MEVVVKTDYQDIYRITSGVLLVVNKYSRNKQYKYANWTSKNSGLYNKLTQGLRILKTEYNDVMDKCVVPKGIILHHNTPIELCGKDGYEYIVKTTGESFYGDSKVMNNYFDEIQEIIKLYQFE